MAYFSGRLAAVHLSPIQASILLAFGLQHKDISAIVDEFSATYSTQSISSSQVLANLTKIMRKMNSHFSDLVSGAIAAEMPMRTIGVSREDADGAFDDQIVDSKFVALERGLAEELEEGGEEVMSELREKQKQMIDALPLDQYDTFLLQMS